MRAEPVSTASRGWETLCESQHNSGYGVNGSFAEYAIGSAAYVGRLPDRPDFSALAPILCAGVTTYKGIKETEARPGEWIVISGVGGLRARGDPVRQERWASTSPPWM